MRKFAHQDQQNSTKKSDVMAEIHRASDAGALFGSFPHSRTAFWFSAEPKVERFLRACLLPIRELDRIIDGRSARIYAIPKCPAIGAREGIVRLIVECGDQPVGTAYCTDAHYLSLSSSPLSCRDHRSLRLVILSFCREL